MTKQLINTGQTSNDGTGDTLRQEILKVNANFNEIYLAIGDGLRLNPPNQTGFALTAAFPLTLRSLMVNSRRII